MADEDPCALNFMKLKKWLLAKAVPKPEVDACMAKEALLLLAEKKGLISAASPQEAPPAASDTAKAVKQQAGEADSVRSRVKQLAMDASHGSEASTAAASSPGSVMSRVKQMALAAQQNQSAAAPVSSVAQAASKMSRVKQMAGAMPMMGMMGMARPKAAPAEDEEAPGTPVAQEEVKIEHLSAGKPSGPQGRRKATRRR
eukprot:TRINITY_DN39282_c0_g1_i1.p1 TRINITY_DN39282_c0_g1~~TRINITY_DN39282_c0_g1_i1.p1  ORF type:complete len:200 (-),score=65.60 TRINITY_DN39282_c0_g1_i1:213-812(-)